ncbi:Hpt domain protein [Pirellulimonas nuda]|uniref:Hpt domain protein n=1 Tax=Pirellulimonas nuda TaxID=2528009 RepID=A0A518D939_9BACT|nr:Hpt domain-containing protein [Pirellulimonas nuda]QDU87987.1 Hpt domain protein [Pirellulimonas nuda]
MDSQDLQRLSDVIDVDDLMRRCLGNIDFASRILGLLTGRCEADLVELEHAIENADVQRIGSVAHRLKGATASGAAHRVSRKADELCRAAATESQEAVSRIFTELRDEWGLLADSLAAPAALSV